MDQLIKKTNKSNIIWHFTKIRFLLQVFIQGHTKMTKYYLNQIHPLPNQKYIIKAINLLIRVINRKNLINQ